MTQHLTWRVIGKSVRGASHVRSGLPNQDALRWLPEWREGPPLILAVSDGHGSAKCFRSHTGSELAVHEAVWLLQDLLDGQLEPANLSMIKRTAEERLPMELVRRWREAVAKDIEKNPITREELAALEEKRDKMARQQVEKHPELAYGATILAVLVASTFTLFLQLGDGDILAVSKDGVVTRPMPEDKRLMANETTSLCMQDAWREVRFRFDVNNSELPVMILVASDGYGNSYVNDNAFFKVGSDILEFLRDESLGPRYVEAALSSWLDEASTAGSGDDITVGILYTTEALKPSATQTFVDADTAADSGSDDVQVDTMPALLTQSDQLPSDTPKSAVPTSGEGFTTTIPVDSPDQHLLQEITDYTGTEQPAEPPVVNDSGRTPPDCGVNKRKRDQKPWEKTKNLPTFFIDE